MGRIGLTELIVILVIVLVIIGPSKLSSLGKSMGVAINQFKTTVNKESDDIPTTDHKDDNHAKTK